jgi:hypothetical protein
MRQRPLSEGGMSSEDDRSRRRGRGERLVNQDNQNLAMFVYQEMGSWRAVGGFCWRGCVIVDV